MTAKRARKHDRVSFPKPAFVMTAPDAPWIECLITDISENGVGLDIGALTVPAVFDVAFTPCGTVRRVCSKVWQENNKIGARFLDARELKDLPGHQLRKASRR